MNKEFHEMFEKQKALQNRNYGVVLPMYVPDNLPMQVTGVVAELGEVLAANEHWKDWKKHPRPIDGSHLLDEVVDLWHFVINVTLYCGYDAVNIEDPIDTFIRHNGLKNSVSSVPLAVYHIIQSLGAMLDTPRRLQASILWQSLIDLTIALGYDFDAIYKAFLEKNKINHIRQDNQY